MKKQAEIFFLGTGGSVPTLERDNTSLLLRLSECTFLVDCPGSIIQKIKKAGREPRDIHSLFITHIHPDHIYGLPALVHALMLEDCWINLFGSEETIEFCQRLLDLFQLRQEKVKCRLEFHPLQPGKKTMIVSGIYCWSTPVPHHSSSLAFQFIDELNQKNLVYSGDTPIFPPLLKKAVEADCLIHDCSSPSRFFDEYPELRKMHTNSLDLGRYAREYGIERLVPCHFFGEVDFSLTEIEEELRSSFQGIVEIPTDLCRIIF
ncbi:MAG: MBL fold metallo-hydrolase [Acidobacteriota bacterium]